MGTSISSRTTVTKVNEQILERDWSFIVFPLESEVVSSGHGMSGLPGLAGWSIVLLAQVERIGFFVADSCLLQKKA